MQKYLSKMCHGTLLVLITILCINMTGGVETQESETPKYVKPKEKAGYYNAKIEIAQTGQEIRVRTLTFSDGNTEFGKVKTEDGSSNPNLNLAHIREIKIEKPSYVSNNYSDQEFVLASIKLIDGSEKTGLLIPRKVYLCGIEVESFKKSVGLENTWKLRKLKKITILHDKKKTVRDIVEKQEKGWWQRMKDFLNI